MREVTVPTTDVNSDSGIVVHWFVDDRAPVTTGDLLVEIETSKAVLEVNAPAAGIILHRSPKGADHPLTKPVALLFDTTEELGSFVEAEAAAAAAAPPASGVRASAKAIARAAELGVDLSTLDVGDALVTVKDVEDAAARQSTVDYDALPRPLTVADGVRRVLLIGGGLGATQVIDILTSDPGQQAVAILDDNRDRWGDSVVGVPIVGGSDRLATLFAEGGFDAVIIAISTSVPARHRLRLACAQAGIPLANAIDHTAKIATDVEIGTGNIICAFSHLGTGVRLGDNNFLSAYNSYDHHTRIGSDCSTGPGCVTSGTVVLGDQVRLGTGIFIEPHVELGDRVQVASGSVIVRSVPADHTVKTKVVTTTVVPNRR